MRLEKKVAMITGAGSGIGRACTLIMAREGAKVVASDVVAERVEETKRMVQERGGECIAVIGDVSKANDIDRMVESALKKFGCIDILINNAGILLMKSLLETSEEEWDRVLTINLKSVFLCSRRVIPEMLKKGGGKIVNIASLAARFADPYQPAYAASKAGVVALTQAMAMEFAQRNIGINCICPGAVRTNIAMPADQVPYKVAMEGIPIGHIGEPEDIAHVALFLASEDSDYLTGEYIIVDGGMSKNLYPVFSSFTMHEDLRGKGKK